MRQVAAKIAQAIMLILAVIILNFFLIQIAPGDVVDALAGGPDGAGEASAEVNERLRETYGLDKPVLVQLGIYIGNVARGDLGESFIFNRPVTELIGARIWPTILLAFTALAFAILLGTFIGTVAARKPESPFSAGISVFALIGFAMPAFWTGILLLLLFSVQLDWLPVSGMNDVRLPRDAGWLERQIDTAEHLLLPAVSLGIIYLASYARLSRASMLEILESDYVRTARSKGLGERSVMFKHALRNGIIPIITVMGLQFGAVVSGAILVETVFAWPGIGRLAFDSVNRRDTNVLLGILLMLSVTVIIANLLTDLLYRVADPRIRVGGEDRG